MTQSKKMLALACAVLLSVTLPRCDENEGSRDAVEETGQDALPDTHDDQHPGTTIRLESGRYVVVELFGHDPADEDLLMAMELVIDMDAGTAVFELQDGSQVAVALVLRDDLLGCCCTMDSCLWGEVADVQEDPLALETMQFASPVLLVSMYDTEGEILLREDDGSYDLYASSGIKHILFEPAP